MAKIILTSEVEGLGSAGDVVEVKDGYARNLLIPRHWATAWTPAGEKQVTSIKRARQARSLATVEDALAARDKLAATLVRVEAQAGKSGRLFGTVTTTEIAQAVKAAGGPALDKRKILVTERIKSVGNYTVKVNLHEEISASINLAVVAAK